MAAKESPYVVIKFPNEVDNKKKPLVELVPMIWLHRVDKSVFCWYPPKRDYRYILTWLKELKPFEKTWLKYPAEIITVADDFAQGLRRLKRYIATANVDSTTDTEKENHDKIQGSAVVVETPSSARRILQNIADSNQKRSRGYSSSSSDASPKPKAKKFKKVDNIPEKMTAHGSNESPIPLPTDTPDKILEVTEIETPKTARSSVSKALSFSSCNSSEGSLTKTRKPIDSEPEVATGKKDNQKSDSGRRELETIIEEKLQDLDSMTASQITQILKYVIAAVRETVEASEKRLEIYIKDCIKRSQSSVAFDVKKRITELKNSITLNYGLKNLDKYAEPDPNKLGIAIPAESIEDFIKLDAMVNDEAHEDFFNGFILTKATNAENYKKGIASVLGAVMAKTVQLQYSGQGKQRKTFSKKNFSETALYKKMQGILVSVFAKDNVKQNDILKYTSVWFAGANDREKGRRNRELNNTKDGENE